MRARTAAVFLMLAVSGLGHPAFAADTKAILLLHSYGFDAPARVHFDNAFVRAVRAAADVKVDLYVETVDPNRFKGEEHARRTRAYLRERYADKQLDVVVAAYDRALAFLLDEGDPIFSGVPTVAVLTRYPQSLPDRVSVLWSGTTFGESAALALRLHPRTRQIALVDGALPGAASDAVYDEALQQIRQAAPNLPLLSLRNLSMDELLVKVPELPQDTVIMIVRQLLGRRGEAISSAEAIADLAAVAPAPMYVPVDLQIGSGAVGGIVVSIEGEATQLANLALRTAKEGSLHLPPQRGAPVAMFDWRQLRRWGVREARLPAGSVVRFRQPGIWDQYKSYILGTVALFALQSALIAGLVVQRARRRKSDAALRESEERFRLMANGAPVMVWTATPDMATDFFNTTVLEFTGLPMEQLVGDGWLERIHPDDVEACRRNYAQAFEARRPFHMEYRFRRVDGSYRWLLDSGVPRYGSDGSFAGYIGSALDITERREMEQSLLDNQAALRLAYEQNQDLAGRLICAQEAERSRIARDLHDDVSQQLAAFGIMLSVLKRSLTLKETGQVAEETIANLQERTTSLARSIRDLSHELHPAMLEQAGLVPALRQHCAQVERLHSIAVTLKAGDNLDSMASEIALCLYRVTQEALTNVVRHAQARSALVELLRTATEVELSVVDDGVGFVVDERSGTGLGLRSIDERVRLIRGHAAVQSRSGEGTTVLARIPLLPAGAPESGTGNRYWTRGMPAASS